MGTVFQHLPKISEETIYSITLKSNKISKMKVFVLCCALFFIGCVNGAPWGSEISFGKRSDDIGQEHLANRAGPQEREVVAVPRMNVFLIAGRHGPVVEALEEKFAELRTKNGNEPKENAGDSKAKKSAAENSEDVKALPVLNRFYGYYAY